MEDQGDPVEKDHSLTVVLPSGLEKTVTVPGSKPVIDLLVTLCARHHLNPADHTVEVLSHSKHHVGFKPSSPIGSLEADTIVLKAKGGQDKTRRPYMPEATVRLLVNYRKSHKTVVRVNPRVPLENLALAISEKCEFPPESTVLLRDSLTREPLDLTKSLNDLGIRELFAKDTTAAQASIEVLHATETPKTDSTVPVEDLQPSSSEKKRPGNGGFLSLFRRKKDKDGRVYEPVSQDLKEAAAVSASSTGLCPTDGSAAATPKKRPAPRPPMTASQSVPDDLNGRRVVDSQRSAESTLRRTKRRAPRPPGANSPAHLPADAEGSAGTSTSIPASELGTEPDWANTSRSPSPELGSPLCSSSSSSSSSPSTLSPSTQLLPRAQEDGLDSAMPTTQGPHKSVSHGPSFLAQLLSSSLSNGKPQNQRGSAPFSKSYNEDDQEGDSISHEPLLAPKCPFGGRIGSGLHLDLWEDSRRRKGTTTFKVVPSKNHRYQEADSRVRESRTDVDPPGSSEPETSSAANSDRGAPAPEGEARAPADSEEVHAAVDEAGVSQAETARPSLQDSGSETRSAEVDRPRPEPESRTAEAARGAGVEEALDVYEEGEVEELLEDSHHVEVKEVVCQVAVKDHGLQNEVLQEEEEEEEEYDQVPDEDDEHFPPPPPPVSYVDDQEEAPDEAGAEEGSTLLRASSSALPLPPAPSSSSSQIPAGPETPKQDPRGPFGASAPLKAVSAAPSRFAQAVALAVQRTRHSQSQSRGRGYGKMFKIRSGPDAGPVWFPQSSV